MKYAHFLLLTALLLVGCGSSEPVKPQKAKAKPEQSRSQEAEEDIDDNRRGPRYDRYGRPYYPGYPHPYYYHRRWW